MTILIRDYTPGDQSIRFIQCNKCERLMQSVEEEDCEWEIPKTGLFTEGTHICPLCQENKK
jgi:hypothetical protein